jgi:hypothetical protein
MYGGTLREQTVGLTKDAGTSQAGSNLSTSANLPTSDTYVSYGGASNLWDTTWTPSEINDSNFGAFFQAYDPLNALDTRWLVAYGFGFTIDSGATIDGILLEIEQRQASGIAYVDHVRITVYYTEGGGGGAASRFLRRRTRRFQRAF